MSDNQIPDCCVAAIHQRLVNMFDFKESFPNISYLSCDHCTNCYRLVVESRKSLTAEIDSTWYYVICQYIVPVEGDEEMESGFQNFVVLSEPQYYTAFKLVYDTKEAEQIQKLNKEVD